MRTTDILSVIRLPEGGFLVREGHRDQEFSPPLLPLLFACTHMDELIAYLRKKLEKQP